MRRLALFPLLFVFASTLCFSAPKTDEAESKESGLFQRTLAMDIDTAGYYELLSWCQVLGISEKGGRKELQQRLRDYYRITPSKEQKKEEEAAKRISIESARKTEYFTIEEINEK
ncbi:MAG: hypothetical protein AB1798_10585, partial [Spirochaetota bacterium]